MFEKLRSILVQAGALGSSAQNVNVFAHWGVAVPHNQNQIESGTSPWRPQITNILKPIIQAKQRHPHPANYDSRNGAFVFPIYSLKHQLFHMENFHIGEEKTPVSFSTLFEETITCGQSRLPTAIQEVMALFKVTITTASEVKSILNDIRDLATGFNSNTNGVLVRGGNFKLRPVQAINADIREANIPDIPADFASKPRQFAHQIIRSIGDASHAVAATKRGGTSFLTAGAAAAEEDEGTATADSDTNPSTQTSNDSSEDNNKIKSKQNHHEETQQPTPQTVDSAASSLTSASGESLGFIQLAEQYNTHQLGCIIELYEETKDHDIRRYPREKWEHALKYRKSCDSGAQHNAVETAAANLAAAETTNESTK
jgi:hypothetical protein